MEILNGNIIFNDNLLEASQQEELDTLFLFIQTTKRMYTENDTPLSQYIFERVEVEKQDIENILTTIAEKYKDSIRFIRLRLYKNEDSNSSNTLRTIYTLIEDNTIAAVDEHIIRNFRYIRKT